MLRDGTAWVGVDAQAVGVQGSGSAVAGLPGGGLKGADPTRYASLSHPGDSYSYDLFSQAGRAVRATTPTSPLGGLPVRRVLALGESQSAFRLVTFINAIQPRDHTYDGFLGQLVRTAEAAVSPTVAAEARAPVLAPTRQPLRARAAV